LARRAGFHTFEEFNQIYFDEIVDALGAALGAKL
jgi:hypothetical protein